MANLESSDVTVTVAERQVIGRKKRVRGTIAFGNGLDTMPVGGVLLPALSAFGLSRNMDYIDLYPSDDNSRAPYQWNKATNRLMPIVDSMSPEVSAKLTEINAHITSTGAGNVGGGDGSSEDQPLRIVLNYVAIGW